MKRSILLGFALLLIFDTTGEVATKLAGNQIGIGYDLDWLARVVQEPLIYVVILCVVGAAATYISVIKHAPVGPAYAIAHGYVLTVLIVSVVFLGESLSLVQCLGGLAIFAGVAILAVNENSNIEKLRSERLADAIDIEPGE